ncbi:kinesin-like protein KIF6 [Xylocopa sonorina]|uniref:kinesin-like protein KIF6 n=1 Tax=Xylocopa sonorina TaxID=1818115 RepID=UPI00403ABAD4
MVKNAIKVYARLKPEKNRKSTVDYRVLHRPRENLEEDFIVLDSPVQKSKDYPDNRPESWNFSFFRIFEEFTTQEDVFDNVARPVVESALDGYNGTIFAYGQTASGKTYTITGKLEDECRGVIPRSLQHLFDVIRKRPENLYTVEVAYLEIYNEIGYDLLDRKQQREFAVTRLEDLPRISTQEDESGKLHLKNLTFHSVTNVEEAFELLLLGDDNRVVAETPMNPQSSRSHCIFTIVISTKQFGVEQYKRAKIHFVDLAGSERVYKCSITGTILTEAKHINLSLHYLEQVIVCLGQESVGHIPYRNSLLTSILRDSLGGNCLTAMLATISIASFNLEETLSTCRFAQRVALIKNELKLNLETDIRSENALLRAENERLRQQIKALTRQTLSDLTAEDKRNLDCQIKSFLASNEQVCWDYNPKKVQYCFESFKKAFELNRDPKSCFKKVEYYKDLVIQRDKEISLLIDMIKKEKVQRPVTTNDNVSTVNNIQSGKLDVISNRISTKKPKRRPKVSSQSKINCDENTCDNIEANNIERDLSRIDLTDQTSRNKSIFTDTVKPDLLPCNVVNLTLESPESKNQVTNEKVNDTPDEMSQQSSRKPERKLKTAVKRHSNKTESRLEMKDENLIKPPTADVKLEAKESPFTETDYSIPVYQKYLSFNAQSPKESALKGCVGVEKEGFDRMSKFVENTHSLNNISTSRKCIKTEEKDFNKISRSVENVQSLRESPARKECTKTEKEDLNRISNSNEADKNFEDSLPLTGDPEIDEEIIAFYKAKRSGGTY